MKAHRGRSVLSVTGAAGSPLGGRKIPDRVEQYPKRLAVLGGARGRRKGDEPMRPMTKLLIVSVPLAISALATAATAADAPASPYFQVDLSKHVTHSLY